MLHRIQRHRIARGVDPEGLEVDRGGDGDLQLLLGPVMIRLIALMMALRWTSSRSDAAQVKPACPYFLNPIGKLPCGLGKMRGQSIQQAIFSYCIDYGLSQEFVAKGVGMWVAL